MSLKNALYIVSIPIGNPDDITLRAIRVLTEVDILVCEEFRNGSRLMKQLGISYRSAGENIAKGYTSAEAVVNAWMASASHRANILSEKYTSMGIGFVDGYWTQWLIG